MTLGEFAYVLDVDPKWVQNAGAALGTPLRYTLATAQRLAVARALSDALGTPLPRAYAEAAGMLRRYDGSRRPVPVSISDGAVAATVDVYRILAAVSAGLSRLRTTYAPRRRGRPSRARRDPIRRAADYGLDLTLLAANLRRTPAERLRQLDAMAEFRRRVRRVRRIRQSPPPHHAVRRRQAAVFEQIIEALVAAGIRFVVIGGVAATIHGSARFTNDIDICYDTAPDNLEALVRLLRKWHAYLRGVERGLPFVLDARALRMTPMMTLTTDAGDIDLLDRVPGIGGYAEARAQSEPVTIGATRFRALTLPALIAVRRATGRAKDVEHLIELEALLALRQRGGSKR
jgi:predicted nucleotidyltransferase